jgi:hypothetical protein
MTLALYPLCCPRRPVSMDSSIDLCGLFGAILLVLYFVIGRVAKWRKK